MIVNKIEIHDENTLNEFVIRSTDHGLYNVFSMRSFDKPNKVIIQHLYREDVEALILFLQKNMPHD